MTLAVSSSEGLLPCIDGGAVALSSEVMDMEAFEVVKKQVCLEVMPGLKRHAPGHQAYSYSASHVIYAFRVWAAVLAADDGPLSYSQQSMFRPSLSLVVRMVGWIFTWLQPRACLFGIGASLAVRVREQRQGCRALAILHIPGRFCVSREPIHSMHARS